MTLHEFFLARWEAEQPAFLKVLRALPKDKLDYTPHERSTKAGDLAWQLVLEQRLLAQMLEQGTVTWAMAPRPASADEIIAGWERATEELRKQLQVTDEAKYASPAVMKMDGAPDWTDSIGNMLWGFLFDMIHHRGQLSTYIRPMGGKVPAIYGPSADEQ
ncbi:MAG: DinB family protein [Thermoanaerobaculia bacterium]